MKSVEMLNYQRKREINLNVRGILNCTCYHKNGDKKSPDLFYSILFSQLNVKYANFQFIQNLYPFSTISHFIFILLQQQMSFHFLPYVWYFNDWQKGLFEFS